MKDLSCQQRVQINEMAGGLWAYLSCYHQCPPRSQLASNGCTGSAYRKHMRCNLYPQTDRMTGQSQGSDKRVGNKDHLGELTGQAHWLRSQRGQVQELTTSCHNPCCAAAVVDSHTWHYNDCARATSTGSSDLTLDLVASKEKNSTKLSDGHETGKSIRASWGTRHAAPKESARSSGSAVTTSLARAVDEMSKRRGFLHESSGALALLLDSRCAHGRRVVETPPEKCRVNSTCKQAKQKKRKWSV